MTAAAHTAVTLLPCPFCGGEASDAGHARYSKPLHDTWWEDGSEITECFFVNCVKCGISNGRRGLVDGYQTRAEAIAAWNQRATTADLQARLEASEAAVRALYRVLGPVGMTLAQQACIDEPLPRDAVILSFMGSGASDQVTVGGFEDAMELARQALTTTRNADAQGGGV